MLEFRHALEGIAAYYAALRGTETDLLKVQQCFLAIDNSSGDLERTTIAISTFHFAVAEASHNVVLLHLMRGMQSLLEQNIRQNLLTLNQRSEVSQKLTEHRKALVDAVIKGEPEQARLASNAHLAFIEEKLLQAGKEHSRIERSLRRTQQN